MNKLLLLFALSFVYFLPSQAQQTHVLFETSYGDFEVELYDDTPRHRDMFLQAIDDKIYHKALFNRVIAGFVNQGGELDEPILKEEADGLRERRRLAPELLPKYFHHKGALGAGRDDNPEKASYLSQIYFVIGRTYSSEELDKEERAKDFTYSAEQRNTYLNDGGVPRLDGDYTIFGRVVRGLDVIERINQVETDKSDMPKQAVRFSIRVLNKSQNR